MTAMFVRRAARGMRSRIAGVLPYESASLLGRKVTVRCGTIPLQPDYDEGWTFALIAQSSRFFDIGCNVGYFSLLAGIQGEREILAVDANARAMALAADNVIRNGFANRVSFVVSFVSACAGQEVKFFAEGTGQASSAYGSHAKTASTHRRSRQVETTTLDQLAKSFGVPDFIKLDVEGAEYDALKGAVSILGQGRTRLLVEMHSSAQTPMAVHGTRVLSCANEHGYTAYYLKSHTKVTDADPFADRGRCHLLLQPSDWAYPEFLEQLEQASSVEQAAELLSSS